MNNFKKRNRQQQQQIAHTHTNTSTNNFSVCNCADMMRIARATLEENTSMFYLQLHVQYRLMKFKAIETAENKIKEKKSNEFCAYKNPIPSVPVSV